jgi:hypothetical protein
MNQEKRDPYDEKTFKKTLELGKHTMFGRKGGGVSQTHEKKICELVYFPRSATPLPLPTIKDHHALQKSGLIRDSKLIRRIMIYPTASEVQCSISK